MTVLSNRPNRPVAVPNVGDDRFHEISRLQNRLDEAEAELAALVALARKRGFDFLQAQGRPLLDEIGDLTARLRRLILDDGFDAGRRRPGASLPARATTAVYADLPPPPRLLRS